MKRLVKPNRKLSKPIKPLMPLSTHKKLLNKRLKLNKNLKLEPQKPRPKNSNLRK